MIDCTRANLPATGDAFCDSYFDCEGPSLMTATARNTRCLHGKDRPRCLDCDRIRRTLAAMACDEGRLSAASYVLEDWRRQPWRRGT